ASVGASGAGRTGDDAVCPPSLVGTPSVLRGERQQSKSARLRGSRGSAAVQEVESAQPAPFDHLAALQPSARHAPPRSPRPSPPVLAHAADALRWEPDGVTLHVRFCEGGGTYP